MKPAERTSSEARGGGRGTLAPESERTPFDWARDAGEADGVIRDLQVYLVRRRRRRLTLAAASFAVLMAVGIAWQLRPRVPAEAGIVATNVRVLKAETRRLPDGSTVDLKADAEIAWSFSAGFRRVTLQKGEAHFQVAKDGQRPFVVSAAGVEVRAVGTAFSVQLGEAAVDVLVTEGQVAVSQPAEPSSATTAAEAPPPAHVASGKRVVVERGISGANQSAPQILTPSATEIEDRLAWRIPRLEFTGTPLAEAIPLFNHYSRVRLVLEDSTLGTLQLSGVLRANNTDSLLRLLERQFGINAVPRDDEIVLRR